MICIETIVSFFILDAYSRQIARFAKKTWHLSEPERCRLDECISATKLVELYDFIYEEEPWVIHTHR